MWGFQKTLLKTFLDNRFVIVLKARQLGISWLACAFALWTALFFENAKVLLMSQGEKEAFELISKCKFMLDHLPTFLRQRLDTEQKGWLRFPELYSEIVALPSTEKAGRSFNATVIINDEYEYHEYAEQNYSAIKPTIGKHGKFICMSTADTEKPSTFFKALYLASKKGDNEFVSIFLPATSRPDRSEEDIVKLAMGMAAHRKQGEYPMTEDDALTIVKTRKYFDASVLATMRLAALHTKPIKHEVSDRLPSIKIWKLPLVGRNYCVVTDPSDGKEDPHASIVMDSVTSECVASSHGKLPADQVAVVHDSLVRLYNNALNTYELNARAGGMFSEKMKALNTPNQCDYLGSNLLLEPKRGKGWYTFPKINQDTFLPLLEESVRMGQIMMYDIDCIDEFNQYFVPEGGVARHPEGGHDDYINAWARALFLRRFIRKEASQPFSFKYKE